MTRDPIQEMLVLCQSLIETIVQKGKCPDLLSIQKKFSDSVESAMQLYESGQIEVNIRSLPPIMYSFAVEELPGLCRGSQEDLKKAKQQLGLFMVTIEELINPRTL